MPVQRSTLSFGSMRVMQITLFRQKTRHAVRFCPASYTAQLCVIIKKMKSDFSQFGKPEKNRSGRKEKTGSPSRAEERKGVEEVEGSDDAMTQIVTEDVSPVPAKIGEKKEEENNKLWEIENEREHLVEMGIKIYNTLVKEGKKEERKEVVRMIKELEAVKDSDAATIQGVIDRVGSVLENIEEKKEEIRSVLEKFKKLEKLENERNRLLDWGIDIQLDGILDEDGRKEVERIIIELGKVRGHDIATVQGVIDEARSVLKSLEIEKELKSLTGRAIVMFMKYRHTYEEGERRDLVKAIRELERVKSLDNATIRDVIDKVAPVLEKLDKEKQEAERSVRNDLRQIERMLVREESDSFENFRESLIEVKAVMESGDVDGTRKQLDLLQETEEYKVLLSRREEREQEEEVSKSLLEDARMVRDYILESQGKLLMPKEEFDLYFYSYSKDFEVSADLRQQNVGDCYLIAAIHAMSRSPNFELFCRSSMKRLPGGSWRVKIPLLSEDGEWITVTKEEILPQKNKKYLSPSAKKQGAPDTREWLRPVRGKEGLRVLEAAYIKKRFSVVDRLAAESGYGGEALMLFGGDNFVKFRVSSEDWVSKEWVSHSLKTLDSKRASFLDSFLENFDPEIHMATVSSGVTSNSSHLLYKGSMTGEPLVRRHAYSIAGVNAEERTITIANPWDTLRPMEMSFDQFKENFSRIEVVRIDNANLLLNMREVGRETGNIQ